MGPLNKCPQCQVITSSVILPRRNTIPVVPKQNPDFYSLSFFNESSKFIALILKRNTNNTSIISATELTLYIKNKAPLRLAHLGMSTLGLSVDEAFQSISWIKSTLPIVTRPSIFHLNGHPIFAPEPPSNGQGQGQGSDANGANGPSEAILRFAEFFVDQMGNLYDNPQQ